MSLSLFHRLPWTSCSNPVSHQFPVRNEHHDIEYLEEAVFFGRFISPRLGRYKLNIQSIELTLNESSAIAYSVPDNKSFSNIMPILLTYRVFDIMNPDEISPRIHSRIPFNFNHCCYIGMGNWFKVVSNARKFFQSNPPEETFLVERTTESYTLRTLYDITTRDEQNKKNKVINNIQVASMHLAYIKQGKLDFVDDEVHSKIAEKLPGLKGVHNLRRLRVPLTMAAFISPICLLMPKKLYDIEVARETILDIWQCLGNQRPPAIKKIEDEIWKLLDGLLYSDDIEHDIFNTLDTISTISNKLESIDAELGAWFKNDQNVVTNTHFGTVYLEDAEHEDDENTPAEQKSSRTSEEASPTDEREHEEEGVETTTRNNDQMEEEIEDAAMNKPDEDDNNNTPTDEVDVDETTPDGPTNQDDELTENNEDEPMDKDGTAPIKFDMQRSTKTRPTIDLASLSSKHSLGRRKAKASMSFKKHIKKKIYHQPMTVQQIIDLSQDWTAPPALNIAREIYPMPDLEPSTRLFSYSPDIYLDYSAHVPHLSDRLFFEAISKSVKTVHLNNPQKSVFYITDHEHFDSFSAHKIQNIFKSQHIIVTDMPLGRTIEFDRKGLETLCPWKKPKLMQDFSIAVQGNDYSKRQVIGSLQLLCKHAHMPNGRVLNALDFPLTSGPSPSLQIASDLRAWDSTMDSPLAARTIEYPTNHMRWGLAASKGAQHTWHIDSMGVGTCVQVKTGSKWWVVGSPKEGRNDIMHIDDESVDIKLSSSNDDIWELEAMLLKPGMMLFMRPNTPHAVFTPEHCITYGSHFVATSTLRETCYGVVHSFVSSSAITNADNNSVWIVLQRLACYYHQIFTNGDWREAGFDDSHIPNVSSSSGILDLYTFMVILELANVLHASTYSKDGLVQIERHRIIEARRLARELRRWVTAHFVVQIIDRPDEDLFAWMLASMSVRLVHYLKEARSHNIKATSPSCTVNRMSAQIYETISNNNIVLDLIKTRLDVLKGHSIKWTEPVSVNPRSKPDQFNASVGFSTTGYTPGDFYFFSNTKTSSAKVNLDTLFFGR